MKSNNDLENTALWDRIGLSASLICIVHCVLTPIILIFIPVFSHWFENRWIHVGLGAVVFPAGMLAFYSGFAIHKNRQVIVLAAIGFSTLAVGLISNDLFVDTIFTIVGGACLATAHVLNLRGCRCSNVAVTAK